MMKALPDLFPSPVAPPKKLGHASEGMLHILEVRNSYMYDSVQFFLCSITWPQSLNNELCVIVFLFVFQSAKDPNNFLQGRPLLSPVVIVCETNSILAIGSMPLFIFPKEDIPNSVMYIMACYYTFHLIFLPEMRSHTPVCGANRGLNGQHTWQRHDIHI